MSRQISRRKGQAAFTLIELLVVIGLVAVLATISVAGYSAASRGMTDRGVVQSTASALRVVQQMCQIDRVPTKVLFCNQRLTDSSNKDDDTLCQGTIIGVKQVGRITIPSETLLIDEFADWHQSYPRQIGDEKSGSGPGMPVYHMGKNAASLSGCRSVVKPSVVAYQLEDHMIQAGTTIDQWCKRHDRTEKDNGEESNGNDFVWGLQPVSGGLGANAWHVGDAYGVEIVKIDLPRGYIFGKKVPSGKDVAVVSVASFDPDDCDDKLRPNLKGDEVQISALQMKSATASEAVKVGTVDSKMLRDD